MMNLKNLLAKLMLAVLLMAGGGHAFAGPTYLVDIHTSSLGTGPAYLGLYFSGLAGAAQASALVDNLSGALAGPAAITGSVTGTAPGMLVFGNQGGGSDFVQGITLGGMFSFDLSFILGSGDIGTTFGWALFSDTGYLGADGDLGTVSIQPGALGGDTYALANNSALSNVQMIPEPSSIALMLLACCMVLMSVRRQR
jgi:hypothetical protein